MTARNTASWGIPVSPLDALVGTTPTNGTEFAIPGAKAAAITWQTVFSSAPSAVNVVLQLSNDGVNYFTADTSTNTTGEIRTINTSARFFRTRLVSKTGGGTTTTPVVLQSYAVTIIEAGSIFDFTLAALISDGTVDQVLGTNGAGLLTFRDAGGGNPFDQDLNTTDDVEFNSAAVGSGTPKSTTGDLRGTTNFTFKYRNTDDNGDILAFSVHDDDILHFDGDVQFDNPVIFIDPVDFIGLITAGNLDVSGILHSTNDAIFDGLIDAPGIISAASIDLSPTNDLTINNVPGVTVTGFTKGILTDADVEFSSLGLTTPLPLASGGIGATTLKAASIPFPLSTNYRSATGTAGVDNTAQTVKSISIPANTLTQLGDSIILTSVFRPDTGTALTPAVTVNGVNVGSTTSGTAAAYQSFEIMLEYIDATHANIITLRINSNGAKSQDPVTAPNVAGFDWTSAQNFSTDQNAISDNHLVVISMTGLVIPKPV